MGPRRETELHRSVSERQTGWEMDPRSEERRVGKEGRYWRDWSSDVCSSDLNGQPGHEIQYQDGKYDGTFTSFHDNGAKHVEQHYVKQEAHGADTGWDRDGKPSYTAQYRNGKQDGKWIQDRKSVV